MNIIKKDIIIPKELLILFKNSVRIIDKKHLSGMWPVDLKQIGKLQKIMPELFRDEAIMKKFDLAVTYNGKSMKVDFHKIGLDLIDERRVQDILIHGIPVPWQLIKKAGIDNKKFNFILTPKIQH
jgi:hypothetical protein